MQEFKESLPAGYGKIKEETKSGSVKSLRDYQSQRREYLRQQKSIMQELNPLSREEFATAKEVARQELRDQLQSLIDFRTEAGRDLNVTLRHTSDKNAWDGKLSPGATITLVPGMHNHWGLGVYFSENDLFDFYKRRRQTAGAEKNDKPITFVLRALDVAGREDFKTYDDPKQGAGRHSRGGLVSINIEDVQDTGDRIIVTGVAAREEIGKRDLKSLRKSLGIKKS